MALTAIQRDVCHLLAARRRARGESYVAGGVALSVALGGQRLSRDLDLFHDTREAVSATWDDDRHTLEAAGFDVRADRERPGLVEATVSRGGDTLLIEWAQDSAFRFFPLVEHEELGLTLHPFDLATNKVLALVGRLEVRDWIDVLLCDERLQPLGYLAWAACGKDPGFTPPGLLGHAGRTARYSSAEVAALAFDGPTPDAAALSTRWHLALQTAGSVVRQLPVEHLGEAVLDSAGRLFRGDPDELGRQLREEPLVFHAGRIGGALPHVKSA